MTRVSSPAKAKVFAVSPPTSPRLRDESGRALDAWGLPLNGPARVAALAEVGLPDPNIDPTVWAGVSSATPLVQPTGAGGEQPAAGKTETDNG